MSDRLVADQMQLLKQRIASHVSDPETLKELPNSTTIFNLLMDPEVFTSKKAADELSIYEESQALMFGGGDTTANVIKIGTFYLLKHPELGDRLKKELREGWPDLAQQPPLRDLEALPYLVSFTSLLHYIPLIHAAECCDQRVPPNRNKHPCWAATNHPVERRSHRW